MNVWWRGKPRPTRLWWPSCQSRVAPGRLGASGGWRRDARPALEWAFCERVELMHQTIDVIALLITTLLTGNELAIGAFVHPVISKLHDAAHAEAAKPLARILGKVMPVWYAGAILVVVVALFTRPVGSLSWWACLTSAVLLAVTVPFTLICLVPLNNRVAALDLSALPGDWKNSRKRWDQYHMIRICILVPASVALIVAAIWRPLAP